MAIESRPKGEATSWSAEIGPKQFAGQESATVTRSPRDPKAASGTSITITHSPGLVFRPDEAALYFPLPVAMNGKPVDREPFLDDSVARTTFDGVEIGVFRSTRPGARNLNFHGVTAESPAVALFTDPKPGGGGTRWSVGYDVIHNPELQLVLPTRDSIVQNSFSERLRAAGTRFLLETVLALKPETVLDHRHWTWAKSAGFTFAEPEPKLQSWRPSSHSGMLRIDDMQNPVREVGPDPFILVGDDIDAADAMPLHRALQANGAADILKAHGAWSGYAWYDAIPRITELRILVEKDGETTDLTDLRAAVGGSAGIRALSGNGRPDTITFEMTATGPDGQTRQIRIPGEIAFGETREECCDDLPRVLLTKESRVSVADLEDMLVSGYFDASSDSDADSWETQLERFTANARALAISKIRSPEEAWKDSVVNDLKKMLSHRLGARERIVIEQTGKGLKIDFQQVETGGENAAGGA